MRIAIWMRDHWALTFLLSLIFPLALLTYWALDRSPPFIQHSVDPIVPVHAGEEVIISADVERQHWRNCSAEVVRDLLDANGILHTPFVDRSKLSAASIAAQDLREANKLRRAFPLPDNIPSGKTAILTHLAYRCAGNPLHAFWPIFVEVEWTFQVLPPATKTIVVIPAQPDTKPTGKPGDPVSVTIEKAKP